MKKISIKKYDRIKETAGKRILISLVFPIAAVLALSGCGLSGDSFGNKEETLATYDQVVSTVNDEIQKGTDGTITVYVSTDVTDDDLKGINHSIDTMHGNVTSITTTKSDGAESRKVELNFERSDAMYVYDHIVSGKEIPADKPKAKELDNVCDQVLKKCIKTGMPDYEKELAIHDYIVNNCSYGKSAKKDDTEYSAYGVLINKKAVCSGYAAAMNLLLSCCGVESHIVSGKAYSVGESTGKMESHAWNQVKLGGQWYNVDVTWDDPVGKEDTLSHEFFNVTDSILKKTHIWDESRFEKCTNMAFNYYQYKGAYIGDLATLENYLKVEIMGGKDKVDVALNNLELKEEDLSFIFNINGVNNVSYSMTEESDYQILVVYINKPN
jgi:hypothetical protein